MIETSVFAAKSLVHSEWLPKQIKGYKSVAEGTVVHASLLYFSVVEIQGMLRFASQSGKINGSAIFITAKRLKVPNPCCYVPSLNT